MFASSVMIAPPFTWSLTQGIATHIPTFPAPVKYIFVPALLDDQYCELDTVPQIGRP
jgi:hypothetical protein